MDKLQYRELEQKIDEKMRNNETEQFKMEELQSLKLLCRGMYTKRYSDFTTSEIREIGYNNCEHKCCDSEDKCNNMSIHTCKNHLISIDI